MCCVSSKFDVEFLRCEVVSDWDSLNWVIAWDVTALSFTCSGLSFQTCLVDNLCQLCHLCYLDVCRSMFCLDVSRRGCSASASSMTRSWWVHYCESVQVQAAIVQFLNRGHVWVVAMSAQNLQGCVHHFGQFSGSVEFCHFRQLCHLFAMTMSVAAADGSIPIMVLAPGIIHEACFIDWSAFWVVCPWCNIDKSLLVGSEIYYGCWSLHLMRRSVGSNFQSTGRALVQINQAIKIQRPFEKCGVLSYCHGSEDEWRAQSRRRRVPEASIPCDSCQWFSDS